MTTERSPSIECVASRAGRVGEGPLTTRPCEPMIGESFPLLAWVSSIARDGNGSAGPPPTRPARGTSLSPGPVVHR
jgi:hypothetical protein